VFWYLHGAHKTAGTGSGGCGPDHAGAVGRIDSTFVDLSKQIAALESRLYESLVSYDARKGDASRVKK